MKIKRAEGIFSIIMLAISAISAMIIFKMINSLKNLMNKMLLLFIFTITVIDIIALSSPIKVVEKEMFTSTFVKEESEKENVTVSSSNKDNVIPSNGKLEIEKDIKINILDIEKNKKKLSNYIYENNLKKSTNNIFIKGVEIYGAESQYLLPISFVEYSETKDIKLFLIKKDNSEYTSFSNDKKYITEDSNIILPLNISEFQGGIY